MENFILLLQLAVLEFELFINKLKVRYFMLKIKYLTLKYEDFLFFRGVLFAEYVMLISQKKDALLKYRRRSVFVDKSLDLSKDAHDNARGKD